MASSTFKLAELSALLARQTGQSAHMCAKLAISLTGIGASISALSEFECNGYKTDRQDNYLCKLSRENPKTANEYARKIQDEGEAYTLKRRESLNRKLSKLCIETNLDIKPAGLSGLVWYFGVNDGREYYI